MQTVLRILWWAKNESISIETHLKCKYTEWRIGIKSNTKIFFMFHQFVSFISIFPSFLFYPFLVFDCVLSHTLFYWNTKLHLHRLLHLWSTGQLNWKSFLSRRRPRLHLCWDSLEQKGIMEMKNTRILKGISRKFTWNSRCGRIVVKFCRTFYSSWIKLEVPLKFHCLFDGQIEWH